MSLYSYVIVYDWNMQLNMDDKQIQTLEQVKQFVVSSQTTEFRGINTNEKYHCTEDVSKKFKYAVVLIWITI